MPDLEGNSFPAVSSSMPCSGMYSLSLDLHVFISRAFSSVQIYPSLQGRATKKVVLLNWVFVLVGYSYWEECSSWEKETIYTF